MWYYLAKQGLKFGAKKLLNEADKKYEMMMKAFLASEA